MSCKSFCDIHGFEHVIKPFLIKAEKFTLNRMKLCLSFVSQDLSSSAKTTGSGVGGEVEFGEGPAGRKEEAIRQ